VSCFSEEIIRKGHFMRYVIIAIVVLLLLTPSLPVTAQGTDNVRGFCGAQCSIFQLAFGAIPTTGDPAADMAGLIALGSTLLTLARMVQASALSRSSSGAALSAHHDSDLDEEDTPEEDIYPDVAETPQG
jgi:hypothetical protein